MEDGIPGGLQHRHKTCCKKGGCCGRQACRVQRWHHHGDVVFRTGGLVYDNSAIQFPTVVLQQSPNSLPSQYIMEDATKSGSLDFRSILNISYTRN